MKDSQTIIQAQYQNKIPSLQRIHLYYGVSFTLKVIVSFIESAISEFNVTRNMTDNQIISTAQSIIDQYPSFNLFDIKSCFEKATFGQYGEVYSSLDKPTIFGWLMKYEQEKSDAIIEYNKNKGGEFAKENGQILSKVDFKVPDYKPKTYDVKENPYQKYFREFDELFKKLENPQSGIRTIEYEGKQLSQEEYVTYRFIEEKTPKI